MTSIDWRKMQACSFYSDKHNAGKRFRSQSFQRAAGFWTGVVLFNGEVQQTKKNRQLRETVLRPCFKCAENNSFSCFVYCENIRYAVTVSVDHLAYWKAFLLQLINKSNFIPINKSKSTDDCTFFFLINTLVFCTIKHLNNSMIAYTCKNIQIFIRICSNSVITSLKQYSDLWNQIPVYNASTKQNLGSEY